MEFKIGIIGDGFVGTAIRESLLLHDFIYNQNLYIYDKYKKKDYMCNKITDMLNCDILFLCLPTQYDNNKETYDLSSLDEVLEIINNNEYTGYCLIKSTVLPNTILNYSKRYSNLHIIHNPEFLSVKTAINDFHNQKHIVLGINNKNIVLGINNKNKVLGIENIDITKVTDFYKKYYSDAEITIIDSIESELMKVASNSFYAIKIQFMTELYLLSNKIGCNYDTVKNTMIKNGWINPMHTEVPGHDGNISYGGLCFPKDTKALQKYMEKENIPNLVLKSTIIERDEIRKE